MSDFRRTTALKQQIASLQAENKDLRDIITSIATSTRTSILGALLALVEHHIGQNGFSRAAELAEALRSYQAIVDRATSSQSWDYLQWEGSPKTKLHNVLEQSMTDDMLVSAAPACMFLDEIGTQLHQGPTVTDLQT
jgi:hypothetical protein